MYLASLALGRTIPRFGRLSRQIAPRRSPLTVRARNLDGMRIPRKSLVPYPFLLHPAPPRRSGIRAYREGGVDQTDAFFLRSPRL